METNGKNSQSSPFLAGAAQFAWIGFVGLVMTAGFYIYVYQGPLPPGPWLRYFTGHWVEFIEVGLFFLALSALMSHGWGVATQFTLMDTVALEPIPRGGQRPDDAPRLLEALDEATAGSDTYLTRRLRDALEFVDRTGSASDLSSHLKYLADNDAIRQSENYSLPMLIVWAIPMLGFLGTVIGITEALGNLSPEAFVAGGDKTRDALAGMLAGLYVAFDTTAIALMFAMTLMFVKFLIEQAEGQLLTRADLRASEQLLGRFQQLGAGNDPHLASVQRMTEQVVLASEQLVQRQAVLWQSTIDAAHQQWSSLLDSAGQHVETALVGALEKSIDSHTQHLLRYEQSAQERSLAHGDQLRTILRENADVLRQHQGEMIRQSEILSKAVAATADVTKLEGALNDNLKTLAGSRHFEETVMSLAATIHLLNSRLSELPLHDKGVSLTPARAQGARRMTRTIANKQPGVALFPFLAVLVCTMGVLILLLVVAMRSSSMAAEVMATEATDSLREQAEKEQGLILAKDEQEFRREGLSQSRDKTAEQLRDEQLKLAHLEEHTRRLEDRLRQLQGDSQAIDAVQQTRLVDRGAAAGELARLRVQVADARAALDATKTAAKPKERFYAIVPYDGPNGTRRRPVYIECLADRVVLQPEGVVLLESDFAPPLDPGNALASALRATREHLQKLGQLGPHGEPYPLLVVRPGGSDAYGAARLAMKAWEAEFGYELVDADMKLAYPPADPVLAATQQRAIADARRRREIQAAAAPSRYGRVAGGGGYRASPRGGFEPVGDEDEGPGQPRWGSPINGRHSPTGRITGDGQTPLQQGEQTPGGVPKGPPPPGSMAQAQSQQGQPNPDQYRPGQMPNRRPQESGGGPATGEPVQSIAATKGENWGLPHIAPRSTGFRRPIVAICEATRIVLIPEAGDAVGGAVIPFNGATAEAALAVVPVIHKRIERWGLAGAKAYWKPVLQTRVAPGGEQRYAELEILLDGSGIELTKVQ